MSLVSETSFTSRLADIGGVTTRDRDVDKFNELVESLREFHTQQIPDLQSDWKETLVRVRASEIVARLQLMWHLRADGPKASNYSKEEALAEYLRLLHQEFKRQQCHAVMQSGVLVIQEGPPPQPLPPSTPARTSSRVAERTDQTLLAAIQELTQQVTALSVGQQKLEARQSKIDKTSQQAPQGRQFTGQFTSVDDIQTAAKLAHQYQQQPRSARLTEALKTRNTLDLDSKDLDTIGDFMDTPLDTQVRARSPFSEPSLLPRFAVHAKEEATRLLEQSMDNASKRRKFASAAEFHRGLKQELAGALRRQDFAQVQLLFNYQIFLSDIRTERGWAAADDYHWRLMAKCGEFDMSQQGCYDPWSYTETSDNFPKTSTKSKNQRPRAPGQRGDKKECSYHGFVSHTTEGCKLLRESPSLKGQRSPTYVPRD